MFFYMYVAFILFVAGLERNFFTFYFKLVSRYLVRRVSKKISLGQITLSFFPQYQIKTSDKRRISKKWGRGMYKNVINLKKKVIVSVFWIKVVRSKVTTRWLTRPSFSFTTLIIQPAFLGHPVIFFIKTKLAYKNYFIFLLNLAFFCITRDLDVRSKVSARNAWWTRSKLFAMT